jgi:glycosyltransferase involved in cell wall biosynthesis
VNSETFVQHHEQQPIVTLNGADVKPVDIKDFRPLNVCLLGYRSKPFCGGQGVYIKYLSSALAKLGHTVDVISGEPYPDLDDNVRLIKMPGLNLYDNEKRFRALRPRHFLSYTDFFEWFSVNSGGFPEPYTFGRRVVKYFAENGSKYDLIHDNQSLCYGLLELQRMGLPVVVTVHHPITKDLELALGSSSYWIHRLLIRRWHTFLSMQKRVVPQLDHLLTVSDQSRKDIADAFKIPQSDISLVYNGIDTDEFAPIEGVHRLPFRIMATASADVPLKGLDFLLKAIAVLIGQFPELELLVVGAPKPGGHTEKLINQLGIKQRVRFVSNLETSELIRHYAEATIAAVPSLYEGFGLPAGEAMACGVPVVSTNGGALPEVVGDAGLQVPVGDIPALTAAIEELLKDPSKRDELGAAGRQRILEKFSWDVAAKEMTRYYYSFL